jgi:hypothetical protein
MRPKTISVEQLGLETGKVVNQARKGPVIVRTPGQRSLVLRPLMEDELVDDLLAGSPSFRASIRRARRRRRAGQGVPLDDVRRQLGL